MLSPNTVKITKQVIGYLKDRSYFQSFNWDVDAGAYRKIAYSETFNHCKYAKISYLSLIKLFSLINEFLPCNNILISY